MSTHSIPVIDLSSKDIPQQIRKACEDYGFFYVTNHNVASMKECFEETEKFFSCSSEFKRKCLCNQGNLGYTSFQDETLAPNIQSCGDTKEGYYIGREPDVDEDQIYTNVWPPYHANLTNWKNIMLKYHSECCQTGYSLVQYIAEALNLPNNYFQSYFERPTALLRLIKYGTIISDPGKGIFGAGEHSDYGMLTLLATNDVSGLQIFLHNEWIDIPPMKDAFIINLGDCFQIMTNYKFKSTLHRVVIDASGSQKDRYSLAFFYEPNRRALISPLPVFNTEETSTIFQPIAYGDYLSQKYEQTHIDYKQKQIV